MPTDSVSTHKLSLAMIVKDEVENLDRCLASVAPYVDEIVVAWNGTNPLTQNVLKKYNCKVTPYEWKDDFADARTFSFNLTQNNYVLWLDADDLVEGAKEIPALLKGFDNPRLGAIWMPYYYDFDDSGNCVMLLWRERIVRKDKLAWKGRIHEVMLPVSDHLMVKEDSVKIIHQVDKSRVQKSAERNLRISENECKRQRASGDVDPRTLYDYGRSLFAIGRFAEAIQTFQEFLSVSDCVDDMYKVRQLLADLYRKARQYNLAIQESFEMIKLEYRRAEAYFDLALTYFYQDKWYEVVWWTEMGYRCPKPEGIMPYDPMAIEGRPLRPLALALFQMGRFKDALETVNKALEYFPKNELLIQMREQYSKAVAQDKIESLCLDLKEYLANHEPEKLRPFAESLPKEVLDHPAFVRLSNTYRMEEPWKNKIIIHCGSTYEFWDSRSVKGGIGGSEEAVISLAPLLAKQGWQVEVYNNCQQIEEVDGVLWKPFWTYDKSQRCAIFVVWRDNRLVLDAPDGAYICYWCHDRQRQENWSDLLINKIDKFFFLSNYHRTDLPQVPEEKVLITANGINPAHFVAPEPRDPLKCIYASSPDRGLDILLDLWPKIRAEVSDAELHVYYGFTKNYDELHKARPTMLKFKEQVLEQLKQPGVIYRGRVGHKEIATAMKQSALWLYPTYFTEISCITAMKAQAAGAIPITTTLAALNETVQFGHRLTSSIYDVAAQQDFVQNVVTMLKNPEQQTKIRKEMQAWAQEHFAWANVARQWHELFQTVTVNKESQCVSG